MNSFYIIVIGTSAGGLTPLKQLLNSLPQNFPAAVCIVKHIPATQNNLVSLLQRGTLLPIVQPKHSANIMPGTIYLAPPGMHMTLENYQITLNEGPLVNHCRPAIDPLFFSASLLFQIRTIGILLSGMLDDGTAGMSAIKACGGICMIQDLQEAEYKEMPQNAYKRVKIDYCLTIDHMASQLIKQVHTQPPIPKIAKKTLEKLQIEASMNDPRNASEKTLRKIAAPTEYSCPACGGVLWKIKAEGLERFRCRVGHAYSLDSLEARFDKSTENALWAAFKALEEKEQLVTHVAELAKKDNSDNQTYFNQKAERTRKQVKILRKLLEGEHPIERENETF